jgi:outer membrane receptor protein involved in Fe transport
VLSALKGVTNWFNTRAFVTAPDTRRGTSGTGNVVGPGRRLWDLSMRKKFKIAEGKAFQFQADFFNAFNMTNFNNPNTTVTDQAFGTVSGAAPGRNIQVGLKFTF